MDPKSSDIADRVFMLFDTYGQQDYIGENVTQQEHAVQCAMMAEKEDGSVEVEIFHICNFSKMPLENKWIVKTRK